MTSRSLQYQPLQLLVTQMDRSARFFPRPSHPPVIPPAQRRRVMHSSSSFSNGHIASPPLPSQYPIIWSNSYPLHMSPSASAETIQPGDFSDLPFDLNDLAAHGAYTQDDVYDQSAVSWPDKVSVAAPATPISTPVKHGSPQMYAVAVTAGSSHYYDSGYEDVCDAQMHHAQSNAHLSPLQAHHVFYNHPHMASIESDMSELYSRRAAREQQQHAEPQQHVVPSEFFPAQPELDLQYPMSSPPQSHCDPNSLSVEQHVPFPTMDSSPSPPGYGSTSPGLTVDDDFDTGDSDADFEEPEDDEYTGTGGVRRHRRRSTHSSVSFSDSSTRRRPSRIAQPVPVPNLTKKSRGRRVPTAPVIVTQGGVQKNLRTYCCNVDGCGKRFARGEHLKRHVRSIHTNDKPHKCPAPGCGKEFSRHDNLGQHMRVHKGYDADDY